MGNAMIPDTGHAPVAHAFAIRGWAAPDAPRDDIVDDLVQAFAQRYRLTPAETRVLRHVAYGRDVSDIAARVCVARSTVRTQVSSVLAKTDCPTQLKLMARLFGAC